MIALKRTAISICPPFFFLWFLWFFIGCATFALRLVVFHNLLIAFVSNINFFIL
jgi:hypothetical protein